MIRFYLAKEEVLVPITKPYITNDDVVNHFYSSKSDVSVISLGCYNCIIDAAITAEKDRKKQLHPIVIIDGQKYYRATSYCIGEVYEKDSSKKYNCSFKIVAIWKTIIDTYDVHKDLYHYIDDIPDLKWFGKRLEHYYDDKVVADRPYSFNRDFDWDSNYIVNHYNSYCKGSKDNRNRE